MLSICERLYPNYGLFVQHTGWGDAATLRAALDEAWQALEEGRMASDWRSSLRQCETVTPDTENFVSSYVSAALDAAVSVQLLLEVLGDFDQSKVIDVAQLAFDTVSMYVELNETTDFPNSKGGNGTLKHPLVQAELRSQQTALEALENLCDDPRIGVPLMRKEWASVKNGSLPQCA
jgi:uncharacterized protein YjaG (DUF416 family)